MKPSTAIQTKSGLAHWMAEVPKVLAKADRGLTNKAVHDLRVMLRRCRSMADSFRAIDPEKNWKRMRRQAKELFDSLGVLRDCHVMMEWVERIGAPEDPITRALSTQLRQQEADLKRGAKAAIENFDCERWIRWTSVLPRRVEKLPLNSEVFQALALERLTTARRLQPRALITGSDVALHRLRIGLKKFRYVVESFLPRIHAGWKDELKHAQDLLGEIHDLDVLRASVDQLSMDAPPEIIDPWRQKLLEEREARIQQYRQTMSGKESLWSKWRAELPRGKAVRQVSLLRLRAWSRFLDSDLQHARLVTRFAIQLYDGLERLGVLTNCNKDDRELLRAAATVHEVGRAAGNKNHHKATEQMVIEQIRQLAGWSRSDITLMARITRYHRGALPRSARLGNIATPERNKIKLLAGILRLANALDADHDGSIQRLTITRSQGFVVVYALGLNPESQLAATIAQARHLLEITCKLPVLVRPMPKQRLGRRPGHRSTVPALEKMRQIKR